MLVLFCDWECPASFKIPWFELPGLCKNKGVVEGRCSLSSQTKNRQITSETVEQLGEPLFLVCVTLHTLFPVRCVFKPRIRVKDRSEVQPPARKEVPDMPKDEPCGRVVGCAIGYPFAAVLFVLLRRFRVVAPVEYLLEVPCRVVE